jgi:hypothetical protein
VLVDFARVLDEERKKADAEVTRATAAGDAKATEKANANLKSTQAVIGNLLKKLAARKELSLAGLINIADLSANAGLAGEAKQVYERVLAIPAPDAQADPRGAAQLKQAQTRARAQLIGILRQAGSFDAAIEQARQLAADNPRALEPQMELGRCLQARAEKDPSKYDEAIAQWTRIRNLLFPVRKRYITEYCEVNYNAAWCKYAQAYQTQEDIQARVTDAISYLKSAMVLNEKLSGPDMVEKYKVLLETLQKYLQESGGAAAPAATPAPQTQ